MSTRARANWSRGVNMATVECFNQDRRFPLYSGALSCILEIQISLDGEGSVAFLQAVYGSVPSVPTYRLPLRGA